MTGRLLLGLVTPVCVIAIGCGSDGGSGTNPAACPTSPPPYLSQCPVDGQSCDVCPDASATFACWKGTCDKGAWTVSEVYSPNPDCPRDLQAKCGTACTTPGLQCAGLNMGAICVADEAGIAWHCAL